MKPRLLDLFCGAGGAAMGYHRAGFEVIGVDIEPQKHYPFEFHQGDAMSWPLEGFDVIHASPPCQRYSVATKAHNGNPDLWPDLVGPTRDRLVTSGLDYVIENVVGAPLVDPVLLCGTMIPGLRVIRHRLFEATFPIRVPPHRPHPLCFTMDRRKPHYGHLDEMTAYVQVTGGGNCSKAAAADAMGIDWMTKKEMNAAVPPGFTEHIGAQLLAHLASERAA